MTVKQCPKCSARFQNDAMFCPMDGNRLTEESDPLIGRRIAGRYLIEEKISTGGMGMVYRSRHMVISRDVAIKFLLPVFARDKIYRHRFLVEARVANQINHAHIVDINDFGETDDGYVYMVMEFLRGRTLGNEIANGPMPLNRVLHIAIQIVQGLARAHDLGVIHRDIKPENIYLVTHKHDSEFVKLLDFGVARLARDMHITTRGTVIGTPEYMSPEQMRGGEVTASTDLYSVGCVLFEMLTGRIPFSGPETTRILRQMTEPPPVPSHLVNSIPPDVDELVLKLLQKKPQQRHRDAHHLMEDLQNLSISLPDSVQQSISLSSLPPRGSLSEQAMKLPSDDKQWLDRIALYRKLIEKKYPKGDSPGWLSDDLNQIETTVKELFNLEQKLTKAVETATKQENNARRTRIRIGNALDQLTRDESKLQRRIEELDYRLSKLQSDMERAVNELQQSTDAVKSSVVSREPLSPDESAVLNRLLLAAKKLSQVQEMKKQKTQKRNAKKNELEDLHFQISQLKGKLGTTNAETMIDKDAIHKKTSKLDSRLKEKLDSVIPVAERILSHFMNDPQYRELLVNQVSSRPVYQ